MDNNILLNKIAKSPSLSSFLANCDSETRARVAALNPPPSSISELKTFLLNNPLPITATSKYKNKKTVKNKDGEDMVIYEYSERQIQNRHKDKADRIEKLRKNLDNLRKEIKKDLKSKDPKTMQTALVVALIDATYERVGNDKSAKEGHFGVTGWTTDHLSFSSGKAHFKYVGKSGVKQHKIIEDANLIKILKDIKNNTEKGKVICSSDDCKVTSSDVNEYLKSFDITAKDIRGLHANEEMKTHLEEIRKKGPDLPYARKEKDKILKEEFSKALDLTALSVGHESSTLRNQYLVPALEDMFMKDGTVIDKLNHKQATKTPAEKMDDEADRLVRPMPKYKPPRKDLRRNRVKVEDKDTDTQGADKDRDLSLNYKRVACQVLYGYSKYSKDNFFDKFLNTTKDLLKNKKKPKSDSSEPSKDNTRLWQTDKGGWGARKDPKDKPSYFKTKQEAELFLKGEPEENDVPAIYQESLKNTKVPGTSITFGQLRDAPKGEFFYDKVKDRYVLRGLNDGHTRGLTKRERDRSAYNLYMMGELSEEAYKKIGPGNKFYKDLADKQKKEEEYWDEFKRENKTKTKKIKDISTDDTDEAEGLSEDTSDLEGLDGDDTAEAEGLSDETSTSKGLETEDTTDLEGLSEDTSEIEGLENEDTSEVEGLGSDETAEIEPVQDPTKPVEALPEPPLTKDPSGLIEAPKSPPEAPNAQQPNPSQPPPETEEQKQERLEKEKQQKIEKTKALNKSKHKPGDKWEDPFDPTKFVYWAKGQNDPEYGLSAKEVHKRLSNDIDETRLEDTLKRNKGEVWFEDLTQTWAVWDDRKNKPTYDLNEVDKDKLILSIERSKDLDLYEPGQSWQESSGKWAVWEEGKKAPTYGFKDEQEVRDHLNSGKNKEPDTKTKDKSQKEKPKDKAQGKPKIPNKKTLKNNSDYYYFDPQPSVVSSLKNFISEENKKILEVPFENSLGFKIPSGKHMGAISDTLDSMDYNDMSSWVESLSNDHKLFDKKRYSVLMGASYQPGLSLEEQAQHMKYIKDMIMFDIQYGCVYSGAKKHELSKKNKFDMDSEFKLLADALKRGDIDSKGYSKGFSAIVDNAKQEDINHLEKILNQLEKEGDLIHAEQLRAHISYLKQGKPISDFKVTNNARPLPDITKTKFLDNEDLSEYLDNMIKYNSNFKGLDVKSLLKSKSTSKLSDFVKEMDSQGLDFTDKFSYDYESMTNENKEYANDFISQKEVVKPVCVVRSDASGDAIAWIPLGSEIHISYALKNGLDIDVDHIRISQELYESKGKWVVDYNNQKDYFDTRQEAQAHLDSLKGVSKKGFLLSYKGNSKSDPLKHSGRYCMNTKLAKKLVATLDQIADLLEQHHAELNFPQKFAFDFAHKCDCVADKLEKTANFDASAIGRKTKGPLVKDSDEGFMNEHFTQENNSGVSDAFESGATDAKKQASRAIRSWFDPSSIGREVGGPLVQDPDEDFMRGEFSMQERRELRTRQESGDMPFVDERPDSPHPGRQAQKKKSSLSNALDSLELFEVAQAMQDIDSMGLSYKDLSYLYKQYPDLMKDSNSFKKYVLGPYYEAFGLIVSLVKSNLTKDTIFKSFLPKFKVALRRDLLDAPYSEQTVKAVKANFLTVIELLEDLTALWEDSKSYKELARLDKVYYDLRRLYVEQNDFIRENPIR